MDTEGVKFVTFNPREAPEVFWILKYALWILKNSAEPIN